MNKNIYIKSDTIKLQQFLKWAGLADTGGQAKEMILSGMIKVNGMKEIRPGRQLMINDLIEAGAVILRIMAEKDNSSEEC